MTLMGLSDEELGDLLLSVARGAVEEEFSGETATEPPVEWLEKRAASFVTLHKGVGLRGCIGSIQPYRSLWEDVRANAKSAAFRDPRFAPLERAELENVTFDVSVLSALEPIEFSSRADLVAPVRPHEDGLLVESSLNRGTFLPAVWGQIADPEQFVDRLLLKAGLSHDPWPAEMRVFRYTTRSWSEQRVPTRS